MVGEFVPVLHSLDVVNKDVLPPLVLAQIATYLDQSIGLEARRGPGLLVDPQLALDDARGIGNLVGEVGGVFGETHDSAHDLNHVQLRAIDAEGVVHIIASRNLLDCHGNQGLSISRTLYLFAWYISMQHHITLAW